VIIVNQANQPKKPRFNPFARRKARHLLLQALYQWQLSNNAIVDIEIQFNRTNDMHKVDNTFFHELLHQIPAELDHLDNKFKPFLDRPLAEVSPIELALLRIGTYELCYRPDIPYKVAINEAVELAKVFGGEDGHKYVNSILDQVARGARVSEVK